MNIENIIKNKEKDLLLTYEEIEYVVNGYVKGIINDDDMAIFLKLIVDKSLSIKETYYLTDVMIKSGEIIDLSCVTKKVVDKHSTGGVGDKLTLIVCPILASLGIGVAKMSGRSLGLTGGTIDKLESINGYNVTLSKDDFIKQVNDIGVSIISQSNTVALADKKIYALRDERNLVASTPLIASSIMSKKIASGADNIVIDLKVGAGAFMKDEASAFELSKYLIEIGKMYNKKVICVLSDMNSIIGKSVGNAIEVKEVIDFFEGKYDKRLYELSLTLSSLMLETSTSYDYETCKNKVKEVLDNGKAKETFEKWISYQGGDLLNLKDNAKEMIIKSNKSGYIKNIDALKVATLVSSLGASRKNKNDTIDYAVGFVSHKSLYEKVEVGEKICSVFYNKEIDNIEKEALNCFEIIKQECNKESIIKNIIK